MSSLRKSLRSLRLAAALGLGLGLAVGLSSCATIVGTAVSPITGGVDLTRMYVGDNSPSRLWAVPFVFIGGVISGPFVAFYNGVNYDPTIFKSFNRYWSDFSSVFRPFELIKRW